jgi:hypothetical protein
VRDEDVLAGAQAALALQVAGDELGRAERSTIVCPARSSGSRSSRTERMSLMSISMCDSDGVPSVSTIALAAAASVTDVVVLSRPEAWTRSISASAPVSMNGIRPAEIAPRRAVSLSTPTTVRPRSAKLRARGSPIRPRPMTATSGTGALMTSKRLAVGAVAPFRDPLLRGSCGFAHERS